MTKMNFYALGLGSGSSGADAAASLEDVCAEVQREAGSACAVSLWNPFGPSERLDQRGILVVKVDSPADFTPRDYLIGRNALALHKAGRIHLFALISPVIASAPTGDVWQDRYRGLHLRLQELAVPDIAAALERGRDFPAEAALASAASRATPTLFLSCSCWCFPSATTGT